MSTEGVSPNNIGTEALGTDALELRYRKLLRGYPRAWRQHREEEVLTVLMDGALEEGRAHPTRFEVIDLMRHAVSARLVQAVPRTTRHRTSVLALVSGVTLSAVSLVLGEVVPWVGPSIAPGTIGSRADTPLLPGSPGTGLVLYLLWLAALVLVAIGRGAAARGILLGSVALGVSSSFIAAHTGTLEPPLWFRGVLVLFALLASLAPIHLTRRGLLACTASATLMAAGLAAMARPWASASTGAPGYAYYRLFGFGLRGIGADLLWAIGPALVVVLLAATRHRLRPWVGPAIGVGAVWSVFAALAGTGPTAWYGARPAAAAFCAAALVGIVWVAGHRVGQRAGRRSTGRPTTS